MTRQPLLALTMGDPAGIGPEITRAAWDAQRQDGQHFVLLADPALFEHHVPIRVIENPADAHDVFADALPILPIPLTVPATPGTPDSANAQPVIESIRRAVALALAGEVDGVVTNPISKAVLRHGGFPHPGHTEFLGELCGTPGAEVMMLACPELRVVPVTVHVSLREALDRLDTKMILHVARTTAAALRRDFGIAAPRLALAGLNPHAGEGGMMGTEEIEMIIPAIEILRAEGLEIIGPMPPDTMFTPAARTRYDAALCMYHDQALIPIKTINMAQGVNVTLGLPIIRTSPDHGTAFDIAGTNIAESESLVSSLRLADRLARNRRSIV